MSEVLAYTQEVMAASGINAIKSYLPIAAASLGVLGTASKAFVRVPEGEMGVKTRWARATRTKDAGQYVRRILRKPLDENKKAGSLYGIVGAGIHPVLPFTHSVERVKTRQYSDILPSVQIDHKDRQYNVTTNIIWETMAHDKNPFLTAFSIAEGEVRQTVQAHCLGRLRKVLYEARDIDDMRSPDYLNENVKGLCSDGLSQWGVELKEFNLIDFNETPASIDFRGKLVQAEGLNAIAQAINNMSGPIPPLDIDVPSFMTGLHEVPPPNAS